MASKLSSFSSRLKDLQKEGENYSALGQILSNSSPASAEMITQASFDNIQSQANSIIEKMKAEIARQQKEAQARAQAAAQQAQQAAQQQAAAAAKQAEQIKPPELPKPEDMTPDIKKYDPASHTFITDQNLKAMANIVSPEERQVMDDETARRLRDNADVAKGIQSPVGFAARGKMFEDAFNTGFNPAVPAGSEPMMNVKTGEREFINKSSIPRFQAAAQAAMPPSGVVSGQGPNIEKKVTPDVTVNPMGGTIPKIEAPSPVPVNKPNIKVQPTITDETIRDAGVPDVPRSGGITPSLPTTGRDDNRRSPQPTVEQPRGMGFDDIASRPAEGGEIPRAANGDPVVPTLLDRLQGGMSQPLEDGYAYDKIWNTGPKGSTGEYAQQQYRVEPEPFPSAPRPPFNPDVPLDPTQINNRNNTSEGTWPINGHWGNQPPSPMDNYQTQVERGQINPKFKSEEYPMATPNGFVAPQKKFEDLVRAGIAQPEDRGYWEARLELDNSKQPGGGFQQKVMPDVGSQTGLAGLEGWRPTSGGGFVHPTKGYAASRAEIEGKSGPEGEMQFSGMLANSAIDKYRRSAGTVLGAGATSYNIQSGKGEDVTDADKRIMAEAVAAIGRGENDANWAMPVLETAARMAGSDSMKVAPEAVDPKFVDDWIKGYFNGDDVLLGDKLDEDLLRLGVSPPGSKMITTGGMDIGSIVSDWAGTKYKFGGSAGRGPINPGNTDCSGFVAAVYKQHGLNLPAHTDAAYMTMKNEFGAQPVSLGEAKPGDVVFYMGAGTGGQISHHMGIYAGGGSVMDMSGPEGKGGVQLRDIGHAGRYEILRDPRLQQAQTQVTTVRSAGRAPVPAENKGNAASPQAMGQGGQAQGLKEMPAQLAGTNPQPGLAAGSGQDGRDMIARVYQRALQDTGDDRFAHSLAALTVGEGGLGGAHGDYGKSTGAFQFYWGGGEGNNFQKWLSDQWGRPVSQKEAMEAAKDIDTSLDYYIPKAYQFYQRGSASEPEFGPLAIALGGHNPGVRSVPAYQEIYRDAWRRYQAGEVARQGAKQVKTIAGVSGG